MDEGREKSGSTTCSVQVQRPHFIAVLTMDGEVLPLGATVTQVMLVSCVLDTKDLTRHFLHNCQASIHLEELVTTSGRKTRLYFDWQLIIKFSCVRVNYIASC